ncbi:MAG: hypothetical protein ACPL7A_03265, partial [Anaerolineales bacterium]
MRAIFIIGAVGIICGTIYGRGFDKDLLGSSALLNKASEEHLVLSELNRQTKTLAQLTSDNVDERVPFGGAGIRSVPKALLFSLVVPGAGEFYCKSYLKAGIMLGFEAAFWVMYFTYDRKGDNKTKEFEAFADEHWKKDLYLAWLSIADTTEVPPVEHLPETKDQQYYEMIGKYNWFLPGWDD